MSKVGKIELNRRTLQNLTAEEVVEVAGGFIEDNGSGDAGVDGGGRTPSVRCPKSANVKCCPKSCSD